MQLFFLLEWRRLADTFELPIPLYIRLEDAKLH